MRGRKNILNFIMLGTGQHRDLVKNILTALADAIEVNDHQSVHLVDGPAGLPKNNTHPMLGTYDPETRYDPVTGEITVKKIPRSEFDSATELEGTVKGEGYKDAIIEARMIVNDMLKAGKSPLEVNLYGFSRGGDTILRIANVLHAFHGEAVKVNIFAVDPVPGIGRQHAKKARVVPPNVAELNAFLMQDERRMDFEAQNRSHVVLQNPNTELNYRIYRGNHGFATRFEANPTEDKRLIHDTPILLWDEAIRFAGRHGIKFKNDKTPKYVVVAGGESGARVYTHLDTKALNDQERLAAYTRMSIHGDEYANFVKTMKNYRSVGVDREFLSRKFDYLLHGEHCFQDREHMQLFKQQFPAVFDYYFQLNLAKAKMDDVKKELSAITSDENLQKFMKERAGIDPTVDPSTNGPKGIYLKADEFYSKPNELRRIWEGVVEAVGAVMSGYDSSISKASAQHLQNLIKEIVICSNVSDDTKTLTIRNMLAGQAEDRAYKNGGAFAYKLATIAGSLPDMDDSLAERTIRKIDQYLNRPKAREAFFKNKALTPFKKAIMETTKKYLENLLSDHLKNNSLLIQTILDAAYVAAGEARSSLGHPEEGAFEDRLREYALKISSYAPQEPLSPKERQDRDGKIKKLMDDYHQELHTLLQPLRNQRLQIYTKQIEDFLVIANRALASRRDILSIDRIINTCEHLISRLQQLQSRLWEDDPTITKGLKALTDTKSALEKAKKEFNDKAKPYNPASALSFSSRAVVVKASPEKLAEEVAKVLRENDMTTEAMGSLADRPLTNNEITEDFVSEKARVHFNDIQTGVGLFAKTTTVASVKWMRDDTYRSDIHFDPAQLSRFGSSGYLRWAMNEVDEFDHTNPMTNRTIEFKGDLPEKFVRYAIAYCKIVNIPYVNHVNKKYEPTKSDINDVREEMLKKSRLPTNEKIRRMDALLRDIPADVPSIPTNRK